MNVTIISYNADNSCNTRQSKFSHVISCYEKHGSLHIVIYTSELIKISFKEIDVWYLTSQLLERLPVVNQINTLKPTYALVSRDMSILPTSYYV